jgi:hypothetical protein
VAKKFQHIEVSDSDLDTLITANPTSRDKLIDFIKYWTVCHSRKVNKTAPDFGKSPEGIWTGKWHRKLTNDDIQIMTAVLRHNYTNTTRIYSEYELNFIQGIEDIARAGNKRNNKQGWQLAMILEEKIV